MKEYRDKLRDEKKLSVARANFYLGFIGTILTLK